MSALGLKLPVEMSISDVADWKVKLVNLLEAGSPVEVDGSELQRLDTASLQLLAVFARTAAQKEIRVTWVATSEELVQAAEGLGLKETLGLNV